MKKVLFVLALFLPLVAVAAPMPNALYLNHETGECGELWGGDEFTYNEPSDGAWEWFMWETSWDHDTCFEVTGYVAYLYDSDPCGFLESRYGLLDFYDLEAVCEVIGYEYVGEIDYESYDTGFYDEMYMDRDGEVVEEEMGDAVIAYRYDTYWPHFVIAGLIVLFGVIYFVRRNNRE